MSGTSAGLREIDAVIFDLDGVVTRTAKVHAAAWKAAFDPLLARAGQPAALAAHGATLVLRDPGGLEAAA